MCKFLGIALLALLLMEHSLKAQCLAGCSSTCSNTEINAVSPAGKKGDWQVSAGWFFQSYESYGDDWLLENSSEEASTYSMTAQQVLALGVTYQFTNRLKAEARMPYSFSYNNKEGHTHADGSANIHDYGDVKGWGDGSVLGYYSWTDESQSPWTMTTGVGMKVPTGQTEVVADYGYSIPIHLQPGSGSWDPVADVRVLYRMNRWLLGAAVYTRIATTALDHNMGNYGRGLLSAGYEWSTGYDRLLSSVVIQGGLNEEINSAMKMPAGHHGVEPSTGGLVPFDNSGYDRLLLITGVSLSFGEHWKIPVAFSVPMYQHYSGYQVPLSWKSSLGVNFSF